MVEKVLEVAVGSSKQDPASPFSKIRSGTAVFEGCFDPVDFADLEEDPGGDAWMIPLGFVELAPNVGVISQNCDFPTSGSGFGGNLTSLTSETSYSKAALIWQ